MKLMMKFFLGFHNFPALLEVRVRLWVTSSRVHMGNFNDIISGNYYVWLSGNAKRISFGIYYLLIIKNSTKISLTIHFHYSITFLFLNFDCANAEILVEGPWKLFPFIVPRSYSYNLLRQLFLV